MSDVVVAGEWIRLEDWTPDPPIVQSLTAIQVWSTLTKRQRELVAACRTVRDPNAEWPRNYAIKFDGIRAAAATMRSLQSKGVVDEHGNLTVPGIYAALWNQLDRDKKRRDARANSSPPKARKSEDRT